MSEAGAFQDVRGPPAGAGGALLEVQDLAVHFLVGSASWRKEKQMLRAVDGVSLSV